MCVLTCVEPCWSFEIHRNREKKKLELEPRYRKCLFLYHYWMHPVFGFMNARIQTWFPFPVQICLNGREWLARSLDKAGIEYVRADNCICRVANLEAAQHFLDEQLRVNWPGLLNELRRLAHPAHEAVFANCPEHARHYYWSLAESEWASDLLFHDPRDVLPLCERLVSYSLRVHGAGQVMRFRIARRAAEAPDARRAWSPIAWPTSSGSRRWTGWSVVGMLRGSSESWTTC